MGDTSRIVYYSRTFPGEFEDLIEWMGLDWIAGILLTQSSLCSKEIMIKFFLNLQPPSELYI